MGISVLTLWVVGIPPFLPQGSSCLLFVSPFLGAVGPFCASLFLVQCVWSNGALVFCLFCSFSLLARPLVCLRELGSVCTPPCPFLFAVADALFVGFCRSCLVAMRVSLLLFL